MIHRRKILLALGAFTATVTLPSLAQAPARVRRIGFFSQASAQANATWVAAFHQGMAELRWVEGRDYVFDARYANGVTQAVAGLADALVATQPDLLLTPTDNGVRLLLQRTRTIPIVFANGQDPVKNGNVASLQRPGGNATGLASMATDLAGKRLQLLKEAFPRVAHVAVLYDPSNTLNLSEVKVFEEAARRLGMRMTLLALAKAADIEPAFKRGAALGAQAYVSATSFVILTEHQAIVERVFRARVPAIFNDSLYVVAGGLMSYASLREDSFRRAAGYVDRILKGAKPGDLPVEQPTRFELVLNLKTAKAMGLTIPDSLLLRADRVIE